MPAELLRRGWIALVPAVLQAAVLLLGPDGTLGVFQAGTVALCAAALVGAFATDTHWIGLRAAPVAALACGLVHLVLAGSGAPAMAWLVLCVTGCAAGVARYGRAIRVPGPAAGVVAVGLLTLAMTGTHWADDIAARAPLAGRQSLRQAIVHLDPVLACAYGAAGHDRLHDADVYDSVPLASTLIERPAPLPTGAAWLAVGLALAAAGWLLERRSAASTP